MIFKSFILLVALCYVHSSPISSSLTSAAAPEVKQQSDVTEKVTKQIDSSVQAHPTEEVSSEKKLIRQARNNKVEYIYVDHHGQIIPKQGVLDKNLVSHSSDATVNYQTLSNKEAEKAASREKKNAEVAVEESKLADKTDGLHYSLNSSGGTKVRSETRRLSTGKSKRPIVVPINIQTKNILALPSSSSSLYSNADINPLNSNVAPYLNLPYIPSLVQSLYNPYYSNAAYSPSAYYGAFSGNYCDQLIASQYYNPLFSSQSYMPFLGEGLSSSYLLNRAAPAISTQSTNVPEEFETKNNANPAFNQNLFGRTFNSYLPFWSMFQRQTPYINPFIPYLYPQQSPNLNYLLNMRGIYGSGANMGLTGSGLGLNFLGQRTAYAGLGNGLGFNGMGVGYPSYFDFMGNGFNYLNFPNRPYLMPSLYPYADGYPLFTPQGLTEGFTPRRVNPTTATTTNEPVQPFSDSTSSSSTTVLPGVTSTETSSLNSAEKPLLYSSHRTLGPVDMYSRYHYYPSIYQSSYFNQPFYPYWNAPMYNRFNSISAYPYGAYSYPQFVSPMHYSAAPFLKNSANEQSDSKAISMKDQTSADKDTVVYRSSKTEPSEASVHIVHTSSLDKILNEDKA